MQPARTRHQESTPGFQLDNLQPLPNGRCYFSAAVAHDMRSPLATINLAVDILTPEITNELHRSYLAMILRASASINLLICELLKHQLPTEVNTCKYSIHSLLDEVLHLAADRLQLKNILVSKSYTPKGYMKTIDPVATKMALMNVIVNAIDSMNPRGQLKLTTLFIDRSFTILIEDDGCGISVENLPKIFLPFYTNKANGLGIGLAAAQAIFNLNKILVNVESIEGAGTKFILSFPKRKMAG